MLINKFLSGFGSSLEWFDFALYAFFAPIFSEVFFSNVDQSSWLSLVITYGILSVGFIFRPIGGLIFSYLGDKYGRLYSLRLTPLLITASTALIAFLPTYETTGNLAIFLLIFLRIFQGIAIGGEFPGNIVYLCEISNKWKYFFGSIASCCGSFGIFLASIISSVFFEKFTHHFLYSYGWRIAFLLSIPIGILIFVVRKNIHEPVEASTNWNPITDVLKNHRSSIFYGIGLIFLHAISFYSIFTFIPIFLIKIRHLGESSALFQNSAFLILHILFIPLLSIVLRKISGLVALLINSLLFFFLSLPLFYAISYGDKQLVAISICIFSLLSSFNAAIIPGLLFELVPKKVRYTVVALTFNLGFGIFGGATPFLSFFLVKETGSLLFPSSLLILGSIVTISVGARLLMRKENEWEKMSISS